jgi:hypothetical protein
MPPAERVIAPPPDDGGDLGHFSRPEDVVMVADRELEPRTPTIDDTTYTHTIHRATRRPRGPGAFAGTILIALLALIATALVSLLARV